MTIDTYNNNKSSLRKHARTARSRFAENFPRILYLDRGISAASWTNNDATEFRPGNDGRTRSDFAGFIIITRGYTLRTLGGQQLIATA